MWAMLLQREMPLGDKYLSDSRNDKLLLAQSASDICVFILEMSVPFLYEIRTGDAVVIIKCRIHDKKINTFS